MCDMVSKSSADNDWRGESDHRALMSAAEIMADKVRMKGVMKHMNKSRLAMKNMEAMMKTHKSGGAFKLAKDEGKSEDY